MYKRLGRHLQKIVLTVLLMSGTMRLFAQPVTIPIATENNVMVLQTDDSNRLNTVYFGKPLGSSQAYADVSVPFHFNDANAGFYKGTYTPAGTWNLSEPAIQVTHADGNTSLELKYVSHAVKNIDANTSLTSIVLQDPVYPFRVTLFYQVWKKENVIEQWTEIQHSEKKVVLLHKYASANLYFTNKDFYLTTFQGEYVKEMQPAETKPVQGMRSVDSKLGTRAMLLQTPNFIVSFGKPAAENDGMVMLGQLAWSGNFKLEYEVDSYHNLRFIAGINPYASEYALPAGQTFKTPSLIYALSKMVQGKPAATCIAGPVNTGYWMVKVNG